MSQHPAPSPQGYQSARGCLTLLLMLVAIGAIVVAATLIFGPEPRDHAGPASEPAASEPAEAPAIDPGG